MKRLLLAVTVLGLAASTAWGASISLFSSPQFASCNLPIPASQGSGTFYIVAVNCDETICCGPGLASVAFSIGGLPAGWITTVTPTPQAAVAIGNPFSGDGAIIAFGSYVLGYYIPLYTVTIVPNPAGASATLTVQASSQPLPFSNTYCPYRTTNSDCPCDPNAACVDGGMLFINMPGDCVVGVRADTWSQVKRLFE